MDENIIKLLSTGVCVAMITGIFSLVIAFLNNKKILSLEKYKQQLLFNQENYKDLKALLEKLIHQESPLKDFPGDPREITSGSFLKLNSAANDRFLFIQNKFDEISHMLSQSNRKTVEDLISEIYDVETELQSFLTEDRMELKPDPDHIADALIKKRVVMILELNKTFIDVVKKQLEEIQEM